ncbi:MAG: sulfite exporter TauE/SafE family protein [Bacteriovoracia bacterium]
MDFLGYAASLMMGVILGLMGGGGSILTVPILVYLFDLPPTEAAGNSLFVVGMTALFGSLVYIRRGDVDFKTGGLFAIPSVIGVNISRGLVVPNLPNVVANVGGFHLTKEILVMASFAALMIAASYSMIRGRRSQAPGGGVGPARFVQVTLQGLIIGVIAGFVGAGGGFLIVPALVLLVGLPMRLAIGTSLMIIALQSLLGFAGDLMRGMAFQGTLLFGIAMTAACGIVAGATFAHRIQEKKLKTAFGWLVLLMGASILIEQFHRLSV